MPVRTLLVDDSQEFLHIAKRILSAVPAIQLVGTAADGKEAIQLAEMWKPELILVDLILPIMNGIEATRQIRTFLPQAIIVILTLYDLAEYREEALTAGADILIHKSELSEDWLNDLVEKQMKPTPKITVLVADDSTTIRRMVMSSLAPIGAQFGEASTGLEAIEQLALDSYDVLILDLNMPDMHGMEVLQFIRQSERYRSLPVIVLTTRGDDSSRREALRAGANLYLTKPFRPSDLIQAVKGLIQP